MSAPISPPWRRSPLTLNTGKNIASVYRTPLLAVDTKCVFTNTTPVGAYRGAGRPEGNYYMERLIDLAAAEMGIDRLELAPAQPHQAVADAVQGASGIIYDSGDFPGVLEQALELPTRPASTSASARARSAASCAARRRPLSRSHRAAQPANSATSVRAGRRRHDHHRHARLRPGPRHAVRAGAGDELGVPFDRITAASRATATASHRRRHRRLALDHGDRHRRSSKPQRRSIARASSAAAHLLEAAAADIEFATAASPSPAPTARIGIIELAQRLRAGKTAGGLPQSLDVNHATEAIAVDLSQRLPCRRGRDRSRHRHHRVVRYTGVNDFGTVVNPMIVAGQVHGGVVQGIGQALLEQVIYDAHGQLSPARSWTTPCRAPTTRRLRGRRSPGAGHDQPLGVKGCGEAGCAGGLRS